MAIGATDAATDESPQHTHGPAHWTPLGAAVAGTHAAALVAAHPPADSATHRPALEAALEATHSAAHSAAHCKSNQPIEHSHG